MSKLLGGKGANLAEMTALGLPVPYGVTITTKACLEYQRLSDNEQTNFLFDLANEVFTVEKRLAKTSTLFSVRSGARVSMPGMMDTVLNVGIESLSNLEKRLGKRAAADCYRRFQHMFGSVVYRIPSEEFENALADLKKTRGVKHDSELTRVDLQVLSHTYFTIIEEYGYQIPATRVGKLALCIGAVFESWNSERAVAYRDAHDIPHDWGTAVNVQQMVYGNRNKNSGSGVLFTRDPSTGEDKPVGEFLPNAQGEDVVAGIRTPLPLLEMAKWNGEVFEELIDRAVDLENHYHDMQDIEFTIENGELYILQTRNGKRSARAAFRIAYDLVKEGAISKEVAAKRVSGRQYSQLMIPRVDSTYKAPADFTGQGASSGVAQGVAVFNKEQAIASDEPCILIRKETTPDDFPGMLASAGILTSTGGATSHAAVVARGMDRPCVVGAVELEIIGSMAMVGDKKVTVGDRITICGETGRVWLHDQVPVCEAEASEEAEAILKWAGLVTKDVQQVSSLAGANALPKKAEVMVHATALGEDFVPVLEVLQERGCTGVLDCRDHQYSDDLEFITHVKADEHSVMAVKLLTAPIDPKRWVVNAPQSEHLRALLEDKGFQLVNLVRNIGEFLKAQGLVDITPEFEEFLLKQGVETVEELLALKDDVRRVKKELPKERLVFELLGN